MRHPVYTFSTAYNVGVDYYCRKFENIQMIRCVKVDTCDKGVQPDHPGSLRHITFFIQATAIRNKWYTEAIKSKQLLGLRYPQLLWNTLFVFSIAFLINLEHFK